MGIQSGPNESYDNVFSKLIERMLCEIIIMDDAKTLLLCHECRLKRRKIYIYPNKFSPIILDKGRRRPQSQL